MTRRYLVLREQSDTLTIETTIEANDADHAIRQAATTGGAGIYIAVPDRNWTKRRVEVEPGPPRVVLREEK